LDYPDFEIIIVSDTHIDKDFKGARVKIISTVPLNPGQKRDMAIDQAKGEVLAFIDDDVYPHKDWLKNALVNFSDTEVAAVGGPAITPEEDSFLQRASGLVYSSILAGGNYAYRFIPKARRQVDDYPSCNFLVRKEIFQETGGFSTNFWPGEDTKLCLDITKKLKKKIIYDPRVLVYHHRRPLFLPHLKQVCAYALHRGYFVKRFPETSLRFTYFIPTLFLVSICLGSFISSIFAPLKFVYFAVLVLYLLSVLISSSFFGLRMIFPLAIGIILTHLVYGFYFLKGLMSPKLEEEI